MGPRDRDSVAGATGDEIDAVFARLEALLQARDRAEVYGRSCCGRPYPCSGCPRRSPGL